MNDNILVRVSNSCQRLFLTLCIFYVYYNSLCSLCLYSLYYINNKAITLILHIITIPIYYFLANLMLYRRRVRD